MYEPEDLRGPPAWHEKNAPPEWQGRLMLDDPDTGMNFNGGYPTS
jgi:hypothetical protein